MHNLNPRVRIPRIPSLLLILLLLVVVVCVSQDDDGVRETEISRSARITSTVTDDSAMTKYNIHHAKTAIFAQEATRDENEFTAICDDRGKRFSRAKTPTAAVPL